MEASNMQDIRIDRIRCEGRDPKKEARDEQEIQALVDAIRVEGLLHPPLVRPHPTEPGFYELVAGYKRLQACARIPGRDTIRCEIRDEMEDDEVEMIRLSENLHRGQLRGKQYYQGLHRWEQLHIKLHPETAKKGAVGGLASGEKRRQQRKVQPADRADRKAAAPRTSAGLPVDLFLDPDVSADDEWDLDPRSPGEPTSVPPVERAGTGGAVPRDCAETPEDPSPDAPDPTEVGDDDAPEPEKRDAEEATVRSTLIQQMAAVLGVSERTVKRDKRVTFLFDFPEEVPNKIFDANPTKEQLETLAQMFGGEVVDQGGVRELVQFLDSGLPMAQAIEKLKTQRAKAAKNDGNMPIDADDLPDDDWLQMHVAKLLVELTSDSCREALKQDALHWKRLRPNTEKYRRSIEPYRDATAAARPGTFLDLTNRVLSVKHPKDWTACPTCSGSGQDGDGPCGCCKGTGYSVQPDDTKP